MSIAPFGDALMWTIGNTSDCLGYFICPVSNTISDTWDAFGLAAILIATASNLAIEMGCPAFSLHSHEVSFSTDF